MDVDLVNQQIQNEARVLESKHDWEQAMDSSMSDVFGACKGLEV